MKNPVWEWLITFPLSAYQANEQFGASVGNTKNGSGLLGCTFGWEIEENEFWGSWAKSVSQEEEATTENADGHR